ncbi:hypothetical protein M2390_000646 [Mycetocola sp. BIGb0189]|uniref:hypothetical protein n=1 Tax=Mycetocola sp. BIGb0189 TaxID=2940604 RepID=UPI0021691725|nr:hypothetical protein [Mycetocola sp. BIGb0189]MCS4275485.1 hypothetical protein [Mycetocola sp. BIGb0189]
MASFETNERIEAPKPEASVSRRNFLLVAGAFTLAMTTTQTLLSPALSSSATVSGPLSSAVSLAGNEITHFNTAFTQTSQWIVPSSMSVTQQFAKLSDARITLSWDPRLALVSGSNVILAHGDSITIVAAEMSGDGQIAFTWPSDFAADGNAGSASVMLPLRARALYPSDGIDAVVPTTLDVTCVNPADSFSMTAKASDAAASGLAWGAELSAFWEPPSETSHDAEAAIPRLVQVTSVGPGPIPVGSIIALSTDRKVINDASVDAVAPNDLTVTEAPSATNSARRAELQVLATTLQAAVPSGASVVVSFTGELTKAAASSADRTRASVSFAGPPAAIAMQRITGHESVTLQD